MFGTKNHEWAQSILSGFLFSESYYMFNRVTLNNIIQIFPYCIIQYYGRKKNPLYLNKLRQKLWLPHGKSFAFTTTMKEKLCEGYLSGVHEWLACDNWEPHRGLEHLNKVSVYYLKPIKSIKQVFFFHYFYTIWK